MSYASEHPHECLAPDCKESVPGSRWDHIKAQAAGWFFPRDEPDGRGYCPKHVPEWVEPWRAQRAAAAKRIMNRGSTS